MKEFLNDTFKMQGTDTADFLEAAELLRKKTAKLPISASEMTIWALTEPGTGNGTFKCIAISPLLIHAGRFKPDENGRVYLAAKTGIDAFEKQGSIRTVGLTKEQIEEVEEQGYFMTYTPEGKSSQYIFLPSADFMATLCRRAGREKIKGGVNVFRFFDLAASIGETDLFHFIVRKNIGDGAPIYKAFAALSEEFTLSPKGFAKNVLSALNAETVKWSVDHFICSALCTFKGKSHTVDGIELKPGFIFEYSDTGDSAYRIRNVILVNGSPIILGKEATVKHKPADESDPLAELLERYEEIKDEFTIVDSFFGSLCDVKKSGEEFIADSIKKAGILGVLGKGAGAEFKKAVKEQAFENAADSMCFLINHLKHLEETEKEYKSTAYSAALGRLFY